MSYYLLALKSRLNLQEVINMNLKNYLICISMVAMLMLCVPNVRMNDRKSDHQLLKGVLIALILAFALWAFVAVVLVYVFHI